MKKFYTYLAGAIEFAIKDGGASWRDSITPALDEAGIYIQDPCKTEPLVTDMTVMEAQEKFNMWISSGHYEKFEEKFAKVVEKDIRMVHRSDFVIVHLFPKIPTTGTIHEMAEAWRLHIPIYLIWPDAKSKLSKWALYLVVDSGGKLFDNKKQLTDYIATIYTQKQSLRVEITQTCKAICRLIGERVYTYKLDKIKRDRGIIPIENIASEKPEEPTGRIIKAGEKQEEKK